jgi:KaiC/GvpD/RAD55 family RecA-like ATPase
MADLKIGNVNITKLLLEKYGKLDTGWVSLVKVPPNLHLEVNKEALSILIDKLDYTCIYITLSKSGKELDKLFKDYGINIKKIVYLDAISKMYGEKELSSKRFNYVSGPLDIDAITSSLHNLMNSFPAEKLCVILDSVTTVLLYNSLGRTLRFSKFITMTLKEFGVSGVMVSVAKGEANKKLIAELSKLCDETINIGE